MKIIFVIGEAGVGKSIKAKQLTKGEDSISLLSGDLHDALCSRLIPEPEVESIIVEEANGVIESEIIIELLEDAVSLKQLIFVSQSIKRDEIKHLKNIEIIEL